MLLAILMGMLFIAALAPVMASDEPTLKRVDASDNIAGDFKEECGSDHFYELTEDVDNFFEQEIKDELQDEEF